MFITVGVRRHFALFGLFKSLFWVSFCLVLVCFSLCFGLRYVFFNSSFLSFPDLLYVFPDLLYVFLSLLCPFPDLLYTFSVLWVQIIRRYKLSRTWAQTLEGASVLYRDNRLARNISVSCFSIYR